MSLDLVASLSAGVAVAIGLLAPGALVARALRLGATPVERLGLAIACGRVLLGVVSLGMASAGGMRWLPWLAAASVVLLLGRRLLRTRPTGVRPSGDGSPHDPLVALLPAIAAAFLLVASVLGGSGVLDAAGDLVFRGKDAVNDPLFYAATAARLQQLGLPLRDPLAADFPIVGHALFYGVLAGLRSIAAALASPWAPDAVALAPLALAFQALPLLDLASLGLAAYALVRALGGTTTGAACGAVIVLLGGDAFALAYGAAGMAGLPVKDVLGWAFFGPFLSPVNPVTPAMQTFFVALCLLARLPRDGTRAALVAGVLVAATGEIKIFVWAPCLAGLVAAAFLAAPRDVARLARLAAGAAMVASLPSVVEKLAFAQALGERFVVGFSACPGCLPRYLVQAAFAGGPLSFDLFQGFHLSDLLAPRTGLVALGASLAFLAIVLGVRLFALPQLLRGSRAASGGSALVHRVIAAAAALGLLLAMGVGTAPHFMNAAQFTWPALYGLWVVLGVAIGRWLTQRRWILLAGVGVLAFTSSLRILAIMGWSAPVLLRVGAPERALLAALQARAAPADVVLEPSWLAHPDLVAPDAWLAGRQVYLSTDAAAAYLPSWERLFRADVLRRVFASSDRQRALQAIEASRARWVHAPSQWPLRFDPAPQLEPVFANESGVLYRVGDAPRSPEGAAGR